jgi:hypothetical protein
MAAQDPIIVVTGGSAKIKFGEQNFHSSSKRDYDDANAKIVSVEVRDGAGTLLQTYNFPDGKFEVKFLGEKKNNNNP